MAAEAQNYLTGSSDDTRDRSHGAASGCAGAEAASGVLLSASGKSAGAAGYASCGGGGGDAGGGGDGEGEVRVGFMCISTIEVLLKRTLDEGFN